jgi:hypothetical protein
MQVAPMPRPSAHIQEATSAGPAPAARAAEKTMAAELVYPTSTVTKPATTADAERSRRSRTAGLAQERWRAGRASCRIAWAERSISSVVSQETQASVTERP